MKNSSTTQSDILGTSYRKGPIRNIAFFVVLYYQPESTNVYIDQTMLGVIDAMNHTPNNLIVRFKQGSCEEGQECARLLDDPSLDGMLLLSPHLEDSKIGFLKNLKVPVVLMYHKPEDPWYAFVDLDNRKGTKIAVEHLVSQGHRRIAFIGGDIIQSTNARDRYEGYRDALTRAGLAEATNFVRHGDFTMTNGYESMVSMLKLPPEERPTALFGATDLIALGAMQAIREAGLRVPWDISVMGFDDIETAQTSDPPLTTVRQPFRDMGKKAVTIMNSLLEDPTFGDKHVLVTPSLVIRSSTISPRRQ